jgi:hypothetical protein
MFGDDGAEDPRRQEREAARERADRLYAGDWLGGRLLAHGKAPYHFEQGNADSYFVRLQTSYGRQVLWGKDLERAVQESKSRVKEGDAVGVRIRHREKLEGDRRFNHWEVEKAIFIVQQRRVAQEILENPITARRAGEHGATITGSYLLIRGAEMLAQVQYTNDADRKRFVDKVREAAGVKRNEFENRAAVTRGTERDENRLGTERPPRAQAYARE